jgi:hypothetical protein
MPRNLISYLREIYMQERRKLTRTRVLKGAKMLLGKSSVIDCVARDLTNSGAGLQVPNTSGLPDTLNLSLDAGHSIRPCRLVWRKLNKTGVEFL